MYSSVMKYAYLTDMIPNDASILLTSAYLFAA